MTAMIRPTLLLRMNLDERVYSDDVVAEIKRSYSYVAPTMVESHDASDGEPENYLDFIVKIRKPYWLSGDEGADELWDAVMLKWFGNMFAKSSNTMVAYNKARREKGEQTLDYAWLELELGERMVALRLNADSSIPEGAVDMVAQVRAACNDGTLPDGEIACVRMPSRASFAEQAAAAAIAPNAAADEEAADDGEAIEASDAQVDAAETAAEASAVDYTVWGIEYKDGTVREFDSSAGAFVE